MPPPGAGRVRAALRAESAADPTGWEPGNGRTSAGCRNVVLHAVTPCDDASSPQMSVSAPRLAVLFGPRRGVTREGHQRLLVGRAPAPALHADERLGEVRYGSWTGRELKDLRKEPLWRVVQGHPSAAIFPDGEGLAAMAARATEAVRDWNARLGPDATYAIVSHGDVIKALVADALGLHLDGFQRIVVDPASLTVVRYADLRPFVVRVNDTGGGVDGLVPGPSTRRGRGRRARGPDPASDAAVGGDG